MRPGTPAGDKKRVILQKNGVNFPESGVIGYKNKGLWRIRWKGLDSPESGESVKEGIGKMPENLKQLLEELTENDP